MKTITFFNIANNRIVCRYDSINSDRAKALQLASTIGGEPVGLFSNGIVFNTTDTQQVIKLINAL